MEVLPLSFAEYVNLMIREIPTPRELEDLFQSYSEVGGFFSRINGIPSSDILWAYVNEVVRFGRSLEVLKEVLSSIFRSAPSPVSYRALASQTSGYSYKVVQSYVEFLQDLFVLGRAYFKEDGVRYGGRGSSSSGILCLVRILSNWSNQPFLNSALYEWIVQEHVYRKFGSIYYRNRYEVDVVADGLRVEVKQGRLTEDILRAYWF